MSQVFSIRGVIVIGLGLVVSFSVLFVGHTILNHTRDARVREYQEACLREAKEFAQIAYLSKEDDALVLSQIKTIWDAGGMAAQDEHLCVLDKGATLILHTRDPHLIGQHVGFNRHLNKDEQSTETLQDRVNSRQDWVGVTVSHTGVRQVGAYALTQSRDWVIGIHRSETALHKELSFGLAGARSVFYVLAGLFLPLIWLIVFFSSHRIEMKRRKAEHDLHLSQDLLEKTQGFARLGSWSLDLKTNQVVWTEELYKMFEADSSKPPPAFTEHSKLFTKESWDQLVPALEKTQKTGVPYELELRNIRKDGKKGWMWVHGEAVFDDQSRIIGLWGAAQDITNRKETERDLKESEERFRALHNASFGGIAIHDQGLILECNLGLSEMTGFSYEELVGMNGLLLITEETRPMVLQKIKSGYEKPYEAEGIRKDGSTYPMRLEARNIPYKGKTVRVVEFRDLTLQKEAENEKHELEGKLQHSQKMEAIGRLAGGVAHDFNNMLSVIIGHVELAVEEVAPNDSVYSDLMQIKLAAERSADLTRQLLAFARKQTVVPRVIDLHKTVASMTKMLKRLIGEDIDLQWASGSNLWPVKMDPSQIDQILANLCVNARDAIEDIGKITIRIENVHQDDSTDTQHPALPAGDYVLLSVEDTGRGMPPETIQHIFEPFFTTKEAGKGTGLGLATVYGIVKQNQGHIRVESEPGKGSAFRIYLQRTIRDSAVKVALGDVSVTGTGKETILLIEDEPAILKMIGLMLQRIGYSVVSADCPKEALRVMRENAGKINLLLSDVVMPEMNGKDLAEELLKLQPDLKCLFMSGYTAEVTALQGILEEGVDFIQKPFTRQELGSKIRRCLGKT